MPPTEAWTESWEATMLERISRPPATTSAAGTSGQIGPNLDQSQASLDPIVEQVTNGGGGMPAFAGQLSDDEIQAVSQYVVENRDPNAEDEGGAGP